MGDILTIYLPCLTQNLLVQCLFVGNLLIIWGCAVLHLYTTGKLFMEKSRLDDIAGLEALILKLQGPSQSGAEASENVEAFMTKQMWKHQLSEIGRWWNVCCCKWEAAVGIWWVATGALRCLAVQAKVTKIAHVEKWYLNCWMFWRVFFIFWRELCSACYHVFVFFCICPCSVLQLI